MKKSKHYRKDVILARIIAALLLIILIALISFGVSLLTKPSEQDKNTQNSENTQDVNQGNQDTENEDTQNQDTESENTEPDVNIDSETETEEKVYVKTTATLRLRVEPNTSCETLERIPEGTQIEVLEELERWYKVIYNGKEGYVSKTYVEVVVAE